MDLRGCGSGGEVLVLAFILVYLFIHKVKDGVCVCHDFLVLFSCLGKDLGRLLPTHQEMKRKAACGLAREHLLAITLFSPT